MKERRESILSNGSSSNDLDYLQKRRQFEQRKNQYFKAKQENHKLISEMKEKLWESKRRASKQDDSFYSVDLSEESRLINENGIEEELQKALQRRQSIENRVNFKVLL